MFKMEIAELLERDGKVCEWAEKVVANKSLTEEEVEISELMDSFAKEIGKTGHDRDNVIASFIQKAIEPEIVNMDDEVINAMFDIGHIGEFDEKEYSKLPENTLKVFDAIRGGSVQKSYLDSGILIPKTINLQCETQVKMSDLRRNGYKTIAKMVVLAEEAFNNEKYAKLFSAIDTALAACGEDQNISNANTAPLETSLDLLSLYVADKGGMDAFMVGLTKYTNRLVKMTGYTAFMSDDMKNEFNKTGKIGSYQGVTVKGFPSTLKTTNGLTIIPDKRILGVAGKIGEFDMKGELRVLQSEDINKEVINLKFTGYDMQYVIYRLDKLARISLQ